MIRILVDSAADYLTAELAERNIEMVPLSITVNEQVSYRDEVELSRERLYALLNDDKNSLKTSQPSPQDFLEKFREIKAAGDDVICILLSSALSGTCQSATLAREMADYDRIFIIDSLSATAAVQIMVDHAFDLIAQGKTSEEIVPILESLKSRTKILAGIDTLKYLYLGGRVSRTTAIVADAASIKPAITVSREGKVEVAGKYLGLSRAIKNLTAQVKKAKIDPNYPIYMIYSDYDTNAITFKTALETAGFKIKALVELGATLGVHVGPGTFGIVYIEG